jgi:hypothetical protein
VKAWRERPVEHRTLLNPSFLALLVAEMARGHEDERSAPMPFVLPFLGVPLVVYEPTRQALPTIATSMFTWLGDVPEARVHIPPLATEYATFTREAIHFGAAHGLLDLQPDGAMRAGAIRRSPRGVMTPSLRNSRGSAHFVGRWLARAGDSGTILSAWGVTP